MQARARQTRDRLLKSALREFSAKGYHGAKVDSIAARAKANKQRIYAYFGNKEKLFASVLRHSFSEIIAEEKHLAELGEQDIPHLAEIILRHYMVFHRKHPHFWRLLAWENLEGGSHTAVLRGLKDESFEHLRSLYMQGQEQGDFKKDVSFESFIFVLTSVCFFYFANQRTMSKTLDLDLSDEAVQERIISEALALLSTTAKG